MNITDLLDRPIAYHRVFVTLTGSVKAAILLSQALYWQKRVKQKDGWWYKTAEEWQDETGLTRHEQDTARRDCEAFLKTKLKDAPARLYWKVDIDALTDALFAEKRQTGLTESDKLVSRKASTINKNAETTTETTDINSPADTFKDLFGRFYGKKEEIRWTALFEAVGKDKAEKLAQWAFKKEIHLVNRPSLLDSMETAAKNWYEKQAKPKQSNGFDVIKDWLEKTTGEVVNGNS